MILEAFKNYYDSHIARLKKNYSDSVKYYSVNGIHDLRVDIKRLRAFFNLISWINTSFISKKNFKKVRKLFKSAGNVRDIQVQMELLRDNNKKNLNLSEYYNYLKNKEISARKEFKTFTSDFNIKILDDMWIFIEASLENIGLDYIKYKTEQRLHNLITELLEFKDKENLLNNDYHKIRILTKESRYTLELMQNSFLLKEFFKSLNDDLRNLHRALGKWHDCQIGLGYLEQFIKNDAHHPLFDSSSYYYYADLLKEESKDKILTFEQKWSEFKRLLRLHDYDVRKKRS